MNNKIYKCKHCETFIPHDQFKIIEMCKCCYNENVNFNLGDIVRVYINSYSSIIGYISNIIEDFGGFSYNISIDDKCFLGPFSRDTDDYFIVLITTLKNDIQDFINNSNMKYWK